MSDILGIEYRKNEEFLKNNNEEKEIEVKASEPRLSAFLDDFLADMDILPNSKMQYKNRLVRFFDYLESEGISTPARRDILAYKEMLSETLSPKTVNIYLTVLRKFFGWCEAYRLYPNIASNIRNVRSDRTRQVREALTSDQVRSILKNIDRDSISGKQRYALVLLATTTGLRCQEMANIDIGDYRTLGDQKILKIQGKGFRGKEQVVSIGPMTDEAIRDCLAARESFKQSDPLFISTSNFSFGNRLSPKGVGKILKKILEANHFIGSEYTAHSFRHTAGTLGLAVSGNDILATRNFLRHCNIETTLGYVDHRKETAREMVNSIEDLLRDDGI